MSKENQIIDFTQVREKKMEEKRANTQRIVFKQILGVYTAIEGDQLISMEIQDISEEGLSFEIPFNPDKPALRSLDRFQIRFYLTQDTYLPVTVSVANSRPAISAGGIRVIRYGCKIDQSLQGYEAYQRFVQFVGMYCEHARKDTGGASLFYL